MPGLRYSIRQRKESDELVINVKRNKKKAKTKEDTTLFMLKLDLTESSDFQNRQGTPKIGTEQIKTRGMSQ